MKQDARALSHPMPVPAVLAFRKTSFYTPPDVIAHETRQPILDNLLLTWTGCYVRAFGHLVESRTLPEFIIIYCVDGCGWLKLAGKRWRIVRGDVFCCPPDLEHAYGADPDDPWTKYYFHFRGQQAASYMALLGLTPDAPVLSIGENTRILSWIHDIFNILRSGYNHGNLLLASALLGNILSYMYYLSLNTALNPSTDMSLEKVITYMLDNINGTLTLDQLSGYAGLSKYHFARLFKTKTGYAPVDYFIRLKIHKACELLEVYTAKISSISASLGFGNPYYFSNTFKRIIGQSPQHYRQMAQFGPAKSNRPDVSPGRQ